MPKNFAPPRDTKACSALHVPKKTASENFTQPPIFSGNPKRNLILSESIQPPSLEYEVISRLIPGLNCNLVKGILFL